MLLYSDSFWEKVNESVARADQFRNGDSPSLLNEGCHCLQLLLGDVNELSPVIYDPCQSPHLLEALYPQDGILCVCVCVCGWVCGWVGVLCCVCVCVCVCVILTKVNMCTTKNKEETCTCVFMSNSAAKSSK